MKVVLVAEQTEKLSNWENVVSIFLKNNVGTLSIDKCSIPSQVCPSTCYDLIISEMDFYANESGLDLIPLFSTSSIIFVTNNQSLMSQAFHWNVCAYVLEEQFSLLFLAALAKFKLRYLQQVTLEFPYYQENVYVKINDIVLIELRNRKPILHLQNQEMLTLTSRSLNCLEKQLTPFGFVRVNDHEIIPKNRIERIVGRNIYVNGTPTPIVASRQKIPFIRQLLKTQ